MGRQRVSSEMDVAGALMGGRRCRCRRERRILRWWVWQDTGGTGRKMLPESRHQVVVELGGVVHRSVTEVTANDRQTAIKSPTPRYKGKVQAMVTKDAHISHRQHQTHAALVTSFRHSRQKMAYVLKCSSADRVKIWWRTHWCW